MASEATNEAECGHPTITSAADARSPLELAGKIKEAANQHNEARARRDRCNAAHATAAKQEPEK